MISRLKQYSNWNKYHHWYEFGMLALCILLPMLTPGYILTLDLVFTPHVAFPIEITNTWLLQCMLWLIHFIVPMDIVEKIILFMILLFSGVGMYRLFLVWQRNEPSLQIGAYFAGLFYMINPFVYSRFMAGQWMVLLGYALLPFCIRSFYAFIQSPTTQKALHVALWISLLLTISLHMTGIVLLAMALLYLLVGRDKRNRRHVRGLLVIAGVPIILSAFWLVPALLGTGTIGESITNFTNDHFTAFETVGGIGSVMRLQGFWVEARNLYVLPQSIMPLWGVWFLVLWVIIFVGMKQFYKTYRSIAIVLALYIGVGVFVSVTPFILWASPLIPLLGGYREPHKFVSLIALSFAFFGGTGSMYIVNAWHKRRESFVLAIKVSVLFLPIIITPTMLWGFSGQLSSKAYPSEWYEANVLLKKRAEHTKTLFLPWHQYANYSFSERIIANPSEKFFETLVISSDQPEYKKLTPTRPDALREAISIVLNNKQNVSELLKQKGVGFIILAKEQDYKEYSFLDQDPGITMIKEDAKLKIYKVKQ